jgi:transposase-like protein
MAREYSPEVKAAVMAALLAGQSISSVARQYEIPKGTVSGWQKQAGNPLGALVNPSPGVATVATQKKQDEILELLLDLVIAQLKSQIALANHLADKTWLMEQDASALGAALGISNDKVFRLLQTLNNDGQGPTT